MTTVTLAIGPPKVEVDLIDSLSTADKGSDITAKLKGSEISSCFPDPAPKGSTTGSECFLAFALIFFACTASTTYQNG